MPPHRPHTILSQNLRSDSRLWIKQTEPSLPQQGQSYCHLPCSKSPHFLRQRAQSLWHTSRLLTLGLIIISWKFSRVLPKSIAVKSLYSTGHNNGTLFNSACVRVCVCELNPGPQTCRQLQCFPQPNLIIQALTNAFSIYYFTPFQFVPVSPLNSRKHLSTGRI